jgi:hypothetical protein
MDTTPVPHPPGSRVWFISDGNGLVSGAPYDADTTVRAKLVPFNTLGVQEIANCPEVSVVLNSRATRPYVPTNFKVNAVAYPVLISGALALTWGHRNRLGTWAYDDAGLTASPEAGCTYTIRLYDSADVLRKTYTALAGTSQTWTTETADSGLPGSDLNTRVRIEIEAVVGALVSFQKINYTVWRVLNSGEWTAEEWNLAMAVRRRRLRATRGRILNMGA